MARTKIHLDSQTYGKTLPLGTTAANGQALLTINNGTAALTNVVLDVKGSQSIAGDLNLVGNLNVTGNINSVSVTNTNVADLTLTLNDGGTTAGAVGGGINIEGDTGAVIGAIRFAGSGKWTIGNGTTQVEIVDLSSAQTLTNKTIGGGQISGNITGNAGNVTGTVAVGNGGTGVTTLSGIAFGNGTGAFTAATGAQISTALGTTAISGNAANVTGTVAIANGGTGQTTKAAGYNALTPITTLGDMVYGDAANSAARLAGNITTSKLFLSQTGTGSVSAAPTWSAVTKGDVGLGNVENTALSTWAGSANITTLGTIGTGTWQGTLIGSTYGGTGVNNGGRTLTVAGNFATVGAFALTLTTTAATNVTLPTTGTLATLAGTETLTNKNLTGAGNTFPTFNQNTTGTAANVTGTVAVANGGTGRTSTTSGALLLGAGTGAMTELVGTTNGHIATWDGSKWTAQAPTGVTSSFKAVAVTGTQDGTNKTFAIASAVAAGSEQIFHNGQLLTPGASNDYVLTGTALVFQAAFEAPLAADTLRAYGQY